MKKEQNLRNCRPAKVIAITLDRFQRDTLESICEKNGDNIEDIIIQVINEYLKGKWLIRCQTCSYEWKIIDLKEMFNPNLICPKCESIQFWQNKPKRVIVEDAYCDKKNFESKSLP